MDSDAVGGMRKSKTAPLTAHLLNNSGLMSDSDESKTSSDEDSEQLVDDSVDKNLISRSSDSSETRDLKRSKRKLKTITKKASSSSSSGSYESSSKKRTVTLTPVEPSLATTIKNQNEYVDNLSKFEKK
jgi:hypothetical protein